MLNKTLNPIVEFKKYVTLGELFELGVTLEEINSILASDTGTLSYIVEPNGIFDRAVFSEICKNLKIISISKSTEKSYFVLDYGLRDRRPVHQEYLKFIVTLNVSSISF